MRYAVVYDDSHTKDFAKELQIILSLMEKSVVSEYDYGMDRIQVKKVCEYISKWVKDYKIDTYNVKHAHGIGNNNEFPVIYKRNPEERQICGYFYCNDDMYGGVYVGFDDLNHENQCGWHLM